MKNSKREEIVSHSAKKLFNIVLDIQSYPEYIPWCTKMVVNEKKSDEIFADMYVKYKFILTQKFGSHVKFNKKELTIQTSYLEGPLKDLKTNWKFEEVKKNKSFIAKEAKTFTEEKKIFSKAPVENIQISNIAKEKSRQNIKTSEQIYILLGSFYSIDTANFLKQRITKDVPEFNIKKLKIKKNNIKENLVISGPYNSINSVKNDYILLKTFGFEELDIFLNE